jgi:hypothetical protein
MSTVIKDKIETDPEEEARLERIKNKPDLSECFNLLDFEVSSLSVLLIVGGGKTSDEENSLGLLFLGRRR